MTAARSGGAWCGADEEVEEAEEVVDEEDEAEEARPRPSVFHSAPLSVGVRRGEVWAEAVAAATAAANPPELGRGRSADKNCSTRGAEPAGMGAAPATGAAGGRAEAEAELRSGV